MKKIYLLLPFLVFLISAESIVAQAIPQDQFQRRFQLNNSEVLNSSIITTGTSYATNGVQINSDDERENIIITTHDKKGTINNSFALDFVRHGDRIVGNEVLIKEAGDIIQLGDGTFAISTILDKDSLNKAITRMDGRGNIVWTTLTGQERDLKNLRSSRSLLLDVPTLRIFHTHVISSGDGSTDIQLTSLNYRGEEEFVKTFMMERSNGAAINEDFIDMQLAADSTILILGTTDDPASPFFLTRMDTLGNEIWTKSYNGDFGRTLDRSGYDLTQMIDGTWVIVGSVTPTQTMRNAAFVMTVDNAGNPLKTEFIRPTIDRYQLYPNGVTGMLDTSVVISMIKLDMLSNDLNPLIVNYNLDSLIKFQSGLDEAVSIDPYLSGLVTNDSIGSSFMTTTIKNNLRIPFLAKLDESGAAFCEDTEDIITIDSVAFTMMDLSPNVEDFTSAIDSIRLFLRPFNGYSPPILNVQDTTYCPQDPVNYFVDATVRGGVAYIWDDDTIDSTRTFTEAGMYMVTVTVSEDLCFVLCDTLTITQLEFPMVSIGKNFTSYCSTGDIILNANVTGAAAEEYIWSTGSTEPFIVVDDTPMNYSVTITDGCDNVASTNGSIGPDDLIAPVEANIEYSCTAAGGRLSVLGSGFIEQQWNTGNTEASITISEPGTYTVVLFDQCNVAQAPISFDVSEDDLPTPVTADLRLLCGSPRVLSIEGTGIASQIWNTGETSSSIELPNSGIYAVTITGESAGSSDECRGVIEEEINISEEEFLSSTGCLIWPNALHPDNRELDNQVFGPAVKRGCEGTIVSYEMRIFNRWGKEIFTAVDVTNTWNGAINGDPQPGGVYYYWAQYDDGNSTCERQGDFTLIR